MALDFPKALIEAQLLSSLFLELLEDDVLALGGEHSAAESKRRYFSVCLRYATS